MFIKRGGYVSEPITNVCHYVPQCFQKAWATDRKVYYYEKRNYKKLSTASNPDGFYNIKGKFYEYRYYHTPLLAVNFLEHYFNEEFENHWITNLENLENKIINMKFSRIKKDVYDLSFMKKFMVLQHIRIYPNIVPAIEETIAFISEKMGMPSDITENQKIEAWQLGLSDTNEEGTNADELLKRFKQFGVTVYEVAEPIEFLLSDNPFFYVRKDKRKILKGYYMTISPRMIMYINTNLHHNELEIRKLNLNRSKILNRLIWNNSMELLGRKSDDDSITNHIFFKLNNSTKKREKSRLKRKNRKKYGHPQGIKGLKR